MNQQDEERDFFPRSELQNAFSLSCQEQKPDDTIIINRLLEQGRFVVVMAGPRYCPRTDAIINNGKFHRGDFATRDEADAFCHENQFDDGEIHWYVLPEFPQEPRKSQENNNNEIPF